MKSFIRLSFFLLLLTSISISASMGVFGVTGKISGKITDGATGDPLPFVNIIIMGTSLGAASDIDGHYSIINIPPGTYEVKASAIGYQAKTMQNVKVSIDLTTSIDFELFEQSIELSEEVIVTATKPLIQKDLTSSTAIVSDELISELPVTEIGDVLELQAGIVSSGGGIHVRGGRSGQVAYQIDGVPVTDSYDGSTIVDVNTSSVKELQVISGAFNAEYGQALSGIINLVTKDGNNKFSGSVQAYSGDYISNKEDIFWNIDDIDPVAIKNIEGSISGPIIKDKLFFFTNLRYYGNEGYNYGRNTYLVTDRAFENPNDPSQYFVEQNGDGSYVPLSENERWFGQAKLSYNLFPGFRTTYNVMYEWQNYQANDGGAKLTPDNNLDRYRKSLTNIFSINHAVSNNSFYTLNLSYFDKNYEHYLFENISKDGVTEYVDNTQHQTPPYSYAVGGTNTDRFERNSKTISAKLDWETQLTHEINVKFGGEVKRHELFYHSINLQPELDASGQWVTPYNVVIPPESSTDNDKYLRKPMEAAAYIQAKFEAFNMIFNAGLRLDVFDPDGQILADPTDPNIRNPLRPSNRFHDDNGNGVLDDNETVKTLAEREAYWFKDASVKTQVSPRLGIAFPITDKGVIHFSYGHFFQLPRYEYLYTNPDFELGVGSGNAGLFGNTDLEPQKTVKGEIGLQQQIGESIAVDVTVFFEDFRNLTGTQNAEVSVFGGGQSYSQYANSDFGFSKGFIFKFSQNFSEGLSANLDYTYSVTKGNASNPADARNAALGGALPETFIAPLNWDQTHTLNISVAYSKARDYGFSLIGNFYSGQPYSPSVNKNTRVSQNAFQRNSDRKPSIFNLNLRAYKDFEFGPGYVSVFVRVFNLLDSDNPTGVYGETGDSYFTFGRLEADKINPRMYGNTLDEIFTNSGFFSEPRRIEVGFSYNF
ncbi:MAG: TonB-dependent receptor [Melioribacteraceae bacterium]|nr:TonB-dependent receptor [Melioribacteraceae bacterium]